MLRRVVQGLECEGTEQEWAAYDEEIKRKNDGCPKFIPIVCSGGFGPCSPFDASIYTSYKEVDVPCGT